MSERLGKIGSVFALSVLWIASVGLSAGDEGEQTAVPDAYLWTATAGESLPIPIPGSEGVVTPFFSWPIAPDAATRLHLGLDPNALVLVASLEPSTNWYIHGPGLMPGITYYWRVDTVTAAGETVLGRIWSFTTQGLRAQSPLPRNGQIHVSQEPGLEWTAGLTAYEQDLYLGTDANAVAQADTGWPQYQNRLAAWMSRYEPAMLDPNTTYFWRVDTVELNGTVHLGNLWTFTTWPQFEIKDPSLKAWWRFDEGQGHTLLDESGYEHHCPLGYSLWVPGRTGTALAFNRALPPVVGPGHDLPVGDSAFTLALWLWPRSWQPDQSLLWWGRALPGMANGLLFRDSYIQHTFGEDSYGVYLGASLGEWTHVTVTHRGQGQRRIFVNGTPQTGVLEGILTPPGVTPGPVHIGGLTWQQADTRFRGVLDDLKIYDRALTEAEIQNLVYAYSAKPVRPYPRDRSVIDVEQTRPFSWQPLRGFQQQELFFGTSRDQVLHADSQTEKVYRGTIAGAQFTPAEPLALGQAYYWRVDTQQGKDAWIRGDLWRFSVAGYLVVDDFESYTDAPSRLIFRTWRDGLGYEDSENGFPSNGTGSIVGHYNKPYAEQGVVYTGSQSLPFYYHNGEEASYSQMDRYFSLAQDWTRRGIRDLQLRFAGDPGNTVLASDRLYVRLADQAGREHWVFFSDPGLDTLLQAPEWHVWSIPLSQFGQQGVQLDDIAQFSVGLGDPISPQPGGDGIVYFDAIHLSVD